MLDLIINGNNYHYSFEQLIRVFLPDVKLNKLYHSPCTQGDFVLCESIQKEKSVDVRVILSYAQYYKEASSSTTGENLYKSGELRACQLLFKMLKECFSYTPEWGIQTGVRPTKIYFNLLRNNCSEDALKYLREELFISEQKIALMKKVCENEAPIIASSSPEQFSLYISIPFCPSRCAYCSFISHAYDSIKKLIPQYIELLCLELREIASISNELGLKLRTVYIGGGTPSLLEIEQLDKIFHAITEQFDLRELTEFTLEAGRPDTLSEEKLRFIKDSPVTRITINAQSFNNDVLKNIGRNHTAEDVYTAYAFARKLGFDNINTDLIAGLEGESVESFLFSVKEAIRLGAENITIHTLALKRSSFLITRDNTKGRIIANTSEMIRRANLLLTQAGYEPYYMYRQSKSVGNLENTSYAKVGKKCEYNVFMMEEVQNVTGAGAGAVTRLIDNHGVVIERVYNFKYPYEYINDFESILKRKQNIKERLINLLNP